MNKDRVLICNRCQEELQLQRTYFTYLGHSFYADVPRCPRCGQVYIPEEMAKGRIAGVEMQLEDK